MYNMNAFGVVDASNSSFVLACMSTCTKHMLNCLYIMCRNLGYTSANMGLACMFQVRHHHCWQPEGPVEGEQS